MDVALESGMAPFSSALDLLSHVDAFGGDFIFVVDRNLFVQSLNKSLSIPSASRLHKDVGSRSDGLFAREVIEALRPKFKATFATGNCLSHESKVLVGGQEVWFDTRLTPIGDMNGRVRSVLGIAREITERKRKEELLAHSRQEWLRAIDTLPYVMASVDLHHHIKKVNVAMAEKLGVTVQEAVGLTCYESIRGLKAPPPFCPLLQSAKDGDAQRADFTEEGNGTRWHITVRSIKDSEGKVVGCLYVGRDDNDGHEVVAASGKNRQIMKQLLTKADHIVLIQDRDGKYIFLSSAPGNGPPPTDFVGKTPFDFFEPDEASRLVKRVRSVADTGLDLSEERELILDGETLTFFDRVSAIRDPLGNVKEVVTVSKRISKGKSSFESSSNPENVAQALSLRESEVLRLIALGLTNRQIADRLFISKKTVETHRARIMRKLHLHKASALVKYAVESGIV